jgi:hypothetical protein
MTPGYPTTYYPTSTTTTTQPITQTLAKIFTTGSQPIYAAPAPAPTTTSTAPQLGTIAKPFYQPIGGTPYNPPAVINGVPVTGAGGGMPVNPGGLQTQPIVNTPLPSFPAIPAPPSAYDLTKKYSDLFGAAPDFTSQFANLTPAYATTKPEDYYTTLRDQLKDALRQEFFGPTGTLQQVASQESAAGRLGSGVGKRIIEESALKPFAMGSTNIDQNILQTQINERQQVEQFNSGQYNDYLNRMATLTQNQATLGVQMKQLAEQAAMADAGLLNQQAIAQLEANVRIWEAAVTDARKAQELTQQWLISQQENALKFLGLDLSNPSKQQQTTAQQLSTLYGGSAAPSSTPTSTFQSNITPPPVYRGPTYQSLK